MMKSYEQLAKDLASDPQDIYQGLSHQAIDLWHGATGVSGEVGELLEALTAHVVDGEEIDLENVIEEIGDIKFYLALILNSIGSTEQDLNYRPQGGENSGLLVGAIQACIKAAKLLDVIKKHSIHGHPLNKDLLLELVGGIRLHLSVILGLLNVTQEQVLAENNRKLAKRYPNGSYSKEDNLARADKEGN